MAAVLGVCSTLPHAMNSPVLRKTISLLLFSPRRKENIELCCYCFLYAVTFLSPAFLRNNSNILAATKYSVFKSQDFGDRGRCRQLNMVKFICEPHFIPLHSDPAVIQSFHLDLQGSFTLTISDRGLHSEAYLLQSAKSQLFQFLSVEL